MGIAPPPSTPQLSSGDSSPGIYLGVARPQIKWSLSQRDRARGVLIAGGQGSGKTSKLIRLALDDAFAANTALVVFDMKGSMAERLLRQIRPDIPKRYYDHHLGQWVEGVKRVWYLDLAAPAFGLTPLHVEAGWRMQDLPDMFVRIAQVVLASLTDLFPGQIFRSSEDIIERAVIGTMAIAWFEHDAYHRAHGNDPEHYGFNGSFKKLVRMFAPTDRSVIPADRRGALAPNPWHVAAGRACQRLPGMAEMAHQMLFEIPGQVTSNLSNMEQRMAPPLNKLGPIVYSHAAVRRFVEHPERLSLASVLQAHDVLIVNPRTEILGDGSQPEILVNLMIHMLNQAMNQHLTWEAQTRPRVSLVIDEAHTLITPSLMRMISKHREAGLNVACATQYMAQIGANLETAGQRDYVRQGVTNLLQTKLFGRMSDPDDAEAAAGVFRAVWESLTRSDPVSQARIPVDAANITTIEDWHFFVHVISSGNCDQAAVGAHAATSWGGSTALPVFTSRAFPMPEVHEIPNTHRKAHLARMAQVFAPFNDDDDQVPTPPSGLRSDSFSSDVAEDRYAAEDVARETVGKRPDRRPSQARDADVNEWREDAADGAAEAPPEDAARLSDESVGGARIQRAPAPEPASQQAFLEIFEVALRPPSKPLPSDVPEPHGERLGEAVAYAAAIESLYELDEWLTAGDAVIAKIEKDAAAAAEIARLTSRAAGASSTDIESNVKQAAARVRRDGLAKFPDQAWHQPVSDLQVREEQMRLLELLVRLPYSHPALLAALLSNPPQLPTLAKNLKQLEAAALVAHSAVRVRGRRGRPLLLYAVTPRGRTLLRRAHEERRGHKAIPAYLRPEVKLPNDGKRMQGKAVPHAVGVQLTLAALRGFGGTSVKMRWMTPDMPGGRLDIRMLHDRDPVVHMRDLLPAESPGLAVLNDDRSAPGLIEPDVTVQLSGQLASRVRSIDMLVEVDRTQRPSYNAPKFVAYDHFLAGWCMRLDRFGPKQRNARPLVLFVCETERAARTLLERADTLMTVGLGLPGHDAGTYQYYGRTHTAFTCLSWLLGGQAFALTMPALPPRARGADVAWEPDVRALLPEAWWPRAATSAPATQHRAAPAAD